MVVYTAVCDNFDGTQTTGRCSRDKCCGLPVSYTRAHEKPILDVSIIRTHHKLV